jgi:hypothetical protein
MGFYERARPSPGLAASVVRQSRSVRKGQGRRALFALVAGAETLTLGHIGEVAGTASHDDRQSRNMRKRNKVTQDELDDLAAEVTALLNDGATHTKEFWKAYIRRGRKRRLDRPRQKSGMPSDPNLLKQAVACRNLASRARRLLGTIGDQDGARILDLVAELEARATTLEKRSSGQCQCL